MIFVKSFPQPDFSIETIIRYAKGDARDSETVSLVSQLIKETEGIFDYKVCYSIFPLSIKGEEVYIDSLYIKSSSLAKSLKDSSRVLLFAATVGVGIDRLINKYSRLSPSKALILQAIGTERIEALCDIFCNETEGVNTYRFSPGYGDLGLAYQRDIFSLLDCQRKIGLTLNDSMIMSPTKSVTAFVGLTEVKE